jgi:DNA helicase-2/ATP-dependent DNA helicase PcrA
LGWQAQPPTELAAGRDKWEALNSLLAIVDELPAGANLVDFAKELEERQRSQHEPIKEAITLSTIHAAKGLEWEMVFVAGLTEGYLPISYAKSDAEIFEEKRLLYVAMTRAKRELTMSWAKSDSMSNREREASRFLNLLRPNMSS